MKLLGKEAEILVSIYRKEDPSVKAKHEKEALQRLAEKGLVTGVMKLTEKGEVEAKWRVETIDRTRDVYDLKAGGGYVRSIHFVYEPITPFSYAWNWCGLRGVSVIKSDPRRGTTYFEVLNSKFWLEGKPLVAEELTFNMPTPKTVEKWGKGEIVSMEGPDLWRACEAYFKFFLDLKEECFYHMLCLAAFQSWLIVDETMFVSCFFIVIKGAYGGGKSVSCEALIFLGRHGKVANPSIAYLGRSIERLGLTVFMDEFDIIVEKDPEMGRLARMCQRRGQSYDRSTKSGTPQSWQVFCPWVISVHGEVEDALATRCIPITTQETGDPNVPVVNPEKVKIGQEIYDQMWMWYLDNIDHISHKAEAERQIDFDLDTLMDRLVVAVAPNGEAYVTTVGKEAKIDGRSIIAQIDGRDITDRIPDITTKSITSKWSNRSIMSEEQISAFRKKVAEAILASCTEKQKKIIEAAAGRNIELMVVAFKIANIVGINIDESIRKAFQIKREVEEEEREIGLVGHLRDFLVDIYKKRRDNPNYWNRDGLFMISNKECIDEFNIFLHRREQFAVTSSEYKQALRELGFIRPTSRKKMSIKTWKEIEEKDQKSHSRLANIYTEAVCRKLGFKTKKPDLAKKSLKEILKDVETWILENKNSEGFVDSTQLAQKITELGRKPQDIVKVLQEEGFIAQSPHLGKWLVTK